jgi:hypothetical protein
MKSGTLNFLEPSAPLQACNEIAASKEMLVSVNMQMNAKPALKYNSSYEI